MNQTVPGNSVPSDAPAKLTLMEQSPRWLGIRLGMALTSGFLAVFLIAVLDAPVKSQYLLDFHGDIRWGRVWLLGMMIGAVMPNVTLSERWTRILLGGLIGIPVALYSSTLIDAFLAERAIARVIPSLPESSYQIRPAIWQLHRPSKGLTTYPTAHHLVYRQTWISGLVCGLLAGCALAATGRCRKILAATAVMISIVLSTLIISKMNSAFELELDRVQATIGKPRG